VSLKNISFYKTHKEDKKSILRFYKNYDYSASFMGYDHTYWVKQGDKVIGSVILSYIDKTNSYALLHALFIDPKYRHQQLALRLLQYVALEHNKIICFADISLDSFYKQAQFTELLLESIPDCMQAKFMAYQKRNKQLTVYTRNIDNP